MSTGVRTRGGFHSILEADHPYVFIDTCMQIWPDADFENAHRHGVTAYAVTAWEPHDDVAEAVERAMFWHLVARRHPNLVVATTADDIRRAKADGKAALILHAQGGDFVGNKLHRVEALQRLGLRIMLLAYNATNLLCDGALDSTDGGLTRFGRLVVDECNRVGVVLDCTHTGKRSTLEIIEHSAKPCIFSHSNASALAPNPRNIDDEQIRACTARGGVIGLASWGPLVLQPGARQRPNVEDFLAHVDHVAQLTGDAEHIGISTDASLGTYPDHEHDPWGEPDYPNPGAAYAEAVTPDVRSPLRQVDGFSDYAEIGTLIEGLGRRGYDDDDIGRILGGNFLRIYDQVWTP
ncbi:MAG: membrane dipeptidase [Vicinamibacterales bacterium]|jgi:membrane dipeptidase|nr:hypothetical protein [Acidobacteriota bacterium]MDP7294364.1 membrane dipeptidase [Vicinamibacterales bacterium]MDP7470744.1 membrane dipeptidase [Vicinamibacterales bacterium]MDP7672450.1 membrane dipeptidase [Vicinamibacterales bacterium]HJO38525.1 membrane dipeptidase [Vicinamibacterales bacterium]|tara:strand:+ start:357 stop:1406 length:1050 start_codon:yes stop_codon:yes gene_type:complete